MFAQGYFKPVAALAPRILKYTCRSAVVAVPQAVVERLDGYEAGYVVDLHFSMSLPGFHFDVGMGRGTQPIAMTSNACLTENRYGNLRSAVVKSLERPIPAHYKHYLIMHISAA